MDKKMKKASISLCLLLAGAFVGFGANALRTETASADVTTDIAMVGGASIRLNTETGVKFSYKIANYSESVNYGMLVVPYDYFAKAGVSIADATDYVEAFTTAYENGEIPYAPAVGTELEVKTDLNGDKYAEYSVTGIYPNNYDRKWFGIGFVENGGAYAYAQYNDNVRDVVSVASGALNAYYYDATLPESTKTAIEANMTTIENFVEKGIANVTEEVVYEVSGATTATVGDNLTYALNVTEGVSLQSVWASSNEDVATVDENGNVTCLSAGETTITAKSANAYASSVTLTVFTNEGDLFEAKVLATANIDDAYTGELVQDTVKEGDFALKYTFTAESGRASLITISDGASTLGMPNVDWAQDVFVGFWIKTDANMGIAARLINCSNGEWNKFTFGYWYHGSHREPQASAEWQYVEYNISEFLKSDYVTTTLPNDCTPLKTENVTNWQLNICTERNAGTFYIDGLSIYNKEMEELIYATAGHMAEYAVSLVTDTTKEGDVALQYAYTHSGNGRARLLVIDSGNTFVKANSLDWTKDIYVGFWLKTPLTFSMCISFMNCSTTWSGDFWDFTYHTNKSIAANSEWQYVEYNVTELMSLAAMNMSLHTENVTDWRMSLASESAESLTFYLDGFTVYNKSE